MRQFIAQQWITVDNIAVEEDGGLSLVSGEPFPETDTSAFKANLMRFIDSVDTLMLGANTYVQSRDYGRTPTTRASTARSSTTSPPIARPSGRRW
jgi:hypothetical protein